jgi:hypothetical protein
MPTCIRLPEFPDWVGIYGVILKASERRFLNILGLKEYSLFSVMLRLAALISVVLIFTEPISTTLAARELL